MKIHWMPSPVWTKGRRFLRRWRTVNGNVQQMHFKIGALVISFDPKPRR
jgi:hypothetical protein